MGAFFTNVQVQASGDASLDAVALCVGQLARLAGMSPVTDGGEADRTVVVLSGPGGWISVYDEATEDQDTSRLDQLALELSRFANGYAVSVLVHDSDVLCLSLFGLGQHIDSMNSRPDYFLSREATAVERKRAAGHPKRWAPVLAQGNIPQALASAWSQELLFAEQTLARTAELLGWSAERARVGYRDMQREAPPGDAARVLRFRLDARPASELDETGPVKLGTDLPAELATLPALHPLAVGDELRVCATCRNSGGKGRGLRMEVRGSAVARNLVQVDSLQLLVGNVMKGAVHQDLEPLRVDLGDTVVLAAETRAELPAGVAGGLASLAGSQDWRAAHDAMARSQVHVNVIGKVLAAGEGDLTISLMPSGAGPESEFSVRHVLVVDAPLFRPRHARSLEGPLGGGSHLVRPLSERDILVAMLVYQGSQAEAAEHAAGAFQRFASACPPVSRYDIGIYPAGENHHPKTATAAGRGYFRTKRWAALRKALATERQVAVAPGVDPADLEGVVGGRFKRKGHGFGFGLPIFPFPAADDDDPELPVLVLWARVDGMTETQTAALRAEVIELVEEGIHRVGAAQALVTRWGQEPNTVDSTVYEQACGIHGPRVARRAWATRWLRAIPNDVLWLGAELRSHLPQSTREALSPISSVDDVGSAWRVALRDGSTRSVERLESVLEAILPTEAVFRQVRRVDRSGQAGSTGS